MAKIATKIEPTKKILLQGEDRRKGQKQARKKYIGQGVAKYLALGNPTSPLKDKYWDIYHCQDSVEIVFNKRKTHYCNNRACPTCASIKTAILISGYNQQLMELTEPQFVTLTCDDKQVNDVASLKKEIERKYKVWRRITKNAVKQHIQLNGVRNIEITYNEVGNWYHSHMHIVVDGREQAEFIVAQWIAINAKLGTIAAQWCQNIKPIDKSREMPFIEIFKYITKIGGKNKQGKRELLVYPPNVYDTIYQALFRKRAIQPFGNIHKVNDEIPEIELTSDIYDLAEGLFFLWTGNDWEDVEQDVALTGYEPSEVLQSLIEQKTAL